ncbi:hypothetical protein J0H58_09115 [bacterium]|nr:hypothetical protein [bacterium]
MRLAPSLFRRFPSAAPRPGWRRASNRRRAVGAVAAGCVLALAAQLGLGLAIRAEVSPLRDPVYFDKFALLRTHPAFFPGPAPAADRPTTLLLVGSSRTLNAVNARRAGDDLTRRLGRPVEVFNFGQAGAGPVTNAVYLRRATQAGVKPDFVLVEVHPVFLAGQRPDPPETRWLLPFRLRPDELPVVRGMGFPAADPSAHGPRGLLAPITEYRFLILDRYFPFLLMDNKRLNGGHEPDAHGFARLQDVSTPPQRAGLMRIAQGQYADYFAGFRPTGCGVDALRDTLRQCRALGARAALVLMPERGGWEAWYDAEGLRQLDAVVAGLAAEFGVPAFDGRKWVTEDETMDGHHLTGPGADRFTDVLARDALAPWIGGPR